jgi:hypothetical protein
MYNIINWNGDATDNRAQNKGRKRGDKILQCKHLPCPSNTGGAFAKII